MLVNYFELQFARLIIAMDFICSFLIMSNSCWPAALPVEYPAVIFSMSPTLHYILSSRDLHYGISRDTSHDMLERLYEVQDHAHVNNILPPTLNINI